MECGNSSKFLKLPSLMLQGFINTRFFPPIRLANLPPSLSVRLPATNLCLLLLLLQPSQQLTPDRKSVHRTGHG
ncbi:hypothetical protein K435DRAFT_70268 [Dendrothele bispora CBS 962.96]|uniref:Uncharacterized protein n=1 Tax=Dendrothele bispora (strain CBS 962.96) TaxID=1314807 RepID=A0A4S8M4R2_DENBC|nr:hypothetical protein K435DRAFT_70268 [Dendrothele bispora CBS 962.96]